MVSRRGCWPNTTCYLTASLSGMRSHFSLVVNQSCPVLIARPWVLFKYLDQVGHSFKDQAISDRTLWKNLLSSGRWTLDVPTCHLERAELQEEAKLFGWSRFISTFTFNTFPNDSGPFWPVAVIRGSPRGFPALLGWKRHLNRNNILDSTFSSFSRCFLFRMKQASKLGRRVGRSYPCAV